MSALQRPLARFERFSTSDVEEARDEVARVYCDHRLRPLAGEGRFSAWQTMVRTGPIAIGAMSYGAEVEIDPGALGDFYLLMLPYAGRAHVLQGQCETEIHPGTAAVLNPDDAARMRWSADCAQFMVRLDRQALETQFSNLLGGASVKGLSFDLAMPIEGGGAHWWRMARLLAEGLELSGGAPNSLASSLQESLLMVSLLELQHGDHSARLGQRNAPLAPRHVRKVEAFIEENADKPMTIEQLVEVSGVSSRALFEGFRRFRGTSPLAHLRAVRLRRVRDDLLTASEADSVTSVAMRWGFSQLGRFAAVYRETFGETPSETLRRR